MIDIKWYKYYITEILKTFSKQVKFFFSFFRIMLRNFSKYKNSSGKI